LLLVRRPTTVLRILFIINGAFLKRSFFNAVVGQAANNSIEKIVISRILYYFTFLKLTA